MKVAESWRLIARKTTPEVLLSSFLFEQPSEVYRLYKLYVYASVAGAGTVAGACAVE